MSEELIRQHRLADMDATIVDDIDFDGFVPREGEDISETIS